jgi:hypothetical protein
LFLGKTTDITRYNGAADYSNIPFMCLWYNRCLFLSIAAKTFTGRYIRAKIYITINN